MIGPSTRCPPSVGKSIGDVHGCFDELVDLLQQLGYSVEAQADGDASSKYLVKPPEGRKVVFLGDLVDRGPKIPQVLRLVMSMVEAGTAMCVPGNHDVKLMRKLRGKDVQITHGLADSLEQLNNPHAQVHFTRLRTGLAPSLFSSARSSLPENRMFHARFEPHPDDSTGRMIIGYRGS